MAGDPQTPAPPETPWWRRVAEFAGVDDEIDAVGSAAQSASDWLRAKLPQSSPEIAAAVKEIEAREAAKTASRQAALKTVADPVKRFFGTPEVKQVGQEFHDRYSPAWTPPAEVKALGAQVQQGITKRSDALRQTLPQDPAYKPIDWMLGAQHDWLPNAIVGQGVDAASPVGMAANLDAPVGPALHALGPVVGKVAAHAAAALPPGFFSRVDRVAEQVGKKGIHPNRLASLLKSGASGEEVAYRRLNDLIAGRGDQLISKAELEAHLAANPPPDVTRRVLGGPNPARPNALPDGYTVGPVDGMPGRFTLVGPDGSGRILYSHTPEEAMDEAISWASNGTPRTLPTKYDAYTLPGGEKYQESLLQLPDRTGEELAQLQLRKNDLAHVVNQVDVPDAEHQRYWAEYQQVAARIEELEKAPRRRDFTAGHWTEPNVLSHTRTKDRTLAGAPGPPVPPYAEPVPGALAAKGWTVRIDREDPFSGRRQMTILDPEGTPKASRGMTALTPEAYLHQYAIDDAQLATEEARMAAAKPTGARGRYVEELQGDWPQQGEKTGYLDPIKDSAELHNAGATLRQAEIAHADRLQQYTGGQLNAGEVLFLSQVSEPGDTVEQLLARLPERADWYPQISGNMRDLQTRARAWLEGQAAAGHRSPVSAAWSASNGLGITERQVREARAALETVRTRQRELVPDMPFKDAWPDLALKQQLLDVAHSPDLNWLGVSGAKTQVDRYGTERLAWRPEGDGFRVNYEPQVGGDALGGDMGQEALARGLITNRSTFVASQEDLAKLLGKGDVKAEKAWKRIQAQPTGGVYLPRKEGMESFYDEALPGKLRKLVGPYGGTVERGGVPVTREVTEDVPGFNVVDPQGFGRGWYPTREAAEAYLANPPQGIRDYYGANFGVGFEIKPQVGTLTVTKSVDEPAWIAHLSPDMKERMRKAGFPLLSFLPPALIGGGAAAAAAASQLDTRKQE